jgi:hypothetical protein
MDWERSRYGTKMHAGFGVENSRIRKLEDAGVFWNLILLKWVLQKENGRLWAGLIWLRIRPSSLSYSQQPWTPLCDRP